MNNYLNGIELVIRQVLHKRTYQSRENIQLDIFPIWLQQCCVSKTGDYWKEIQNGEAQAHNCCKDEGLQGHALWGVDSTAREINLGLRQPA